MSVFIRFKLLSAVQYIRHVLCFTFFRITTLCFVYCFAHSSPSFHELHEAPEMVFQQSQKSSSGMLSTCWPFFAFTLGSISFQTISIGFRSRDCGGQVPSSQQSHLENQHFNAAYHKHQYFTTVAGKVNYRFFITKFILKSPFCAPSFIILLFFSLPVSCCSRKWEL